MYQKNYQFSGHHFWKHCCLGLFCLFLGFHNTLCEQGPAAIHRTHLGTSLHTRTDQCRHIRRTDRPNRTWNKSILKHSLNWSTWQKEKGLRIWAFNLWDIIFLLWSMIYISLTKKRLDQFSSQKSSKTKAKEILRHFQVSRIHCVLIRTSITKPR